MDGYPGRIVVIVNGNCFISINEIHYITFFTKVKLSYN